MNYPNVTKYVLRLRLFSFSLEERANEWYHLIPSKKITTCDGLVEAFVKKFYPHHKTAAVRQSIQNFKQKICESIHDYAERFNELLYQFPHHGFEKGHMAQILYEGLDSETRMQVETISGEEFTHQDPDVCFDKLIELAEKTCQWASMREPEITRNPIHSINKVDNGSDILRRIEDLEMNQGSNQTTSCNSEPRTYPCTIFGDQSHIGPHCPLFYPNETTRDQVSVLHGGMNSKYEGRPKLDPYSNTYNPGWRHNPNFSWSKGNHQGGPYSNPPTGFSRNQAQVHESSQVDKKVSSLEERIRLLIEDDALNNSQTTQNINHLSQKLDNFILTSQRSQQNSDRVIANLEIQISQLSNRLNDRGNETFSSQTTPNPKGFNQVNRSGSSIHNEHIKAVITLRSKTLENSIEPPKDSSPAEKETEVDQTSSKDPNGPESAEIPSKQTIYNALLELGASVNLLPFSVYEQLGLGEMKPTRITLQFADRSVKIPCGIIEDVLVQAYLAHFGAYYDEDSHSEEVNASLDSAPVVNYGKWQRKPERLPPTIDKPLPSSVKAPTLELKTLPVTLKYVFLGSESTLPAIISSYLEPDQECILVSVLCEHKTAIGWTIEDFKVISPSDCMHHIYLE
ncbi:uncharacterized protein LOC113311796 [Papaver somniferum]|uniref:uncharacterized protein LOC113311796 n=1 Tax=Papaver somniferum TaxID=3469 RepID=UPI000E705279|nr:uncharacterized protein LOC113311796 [Papaver somniferum]